MQTPTPGQAAISEGPNRGMEAASKVVCRDEERHPRRTEAQGSRVPLWPPRLSRGARGVSVEVSARGERKLSTSMLTPPPPSAVTSSIRRLHIAVQRTGAVVSVLGKRKAAGPSRLVGAAARAAVSSRVGGGSVGERHTIELKGVVVLQPADFRDGDNVVYLCAAWRRLWKEEITSVDALHASSLAKRTMGRYCTYYKKLALWVGYTLIAK